MTSQDFSQDFVQSCITSVSFPETLEAVRRMVKKNEYIGKGLTDMDTLQRRCAGGWTAPRWMTLGDILFFYHTKTAKKRADALYKRAVEEGGQEKSFVRLLKRATETADRYAGTIFGCAQVAGAAEYDRSELFHFDSRSFAPLRKIHMFGHPLPAERFADYVRIGQSATTNIDADEFNGIRSQLEEQNRLPGYLKEARFGELSFRDVSPKTWRKISCAPNARFIHEAQFRDYLLDYLLSEIKDEGTSLLKECKCYPRNPSLGIADYFIKVADHWIPVEAKINILAEKHILSQVAQYVQIDSFTPTLGAHRHESFEVSRSTVCILADQSGIYIVKDGQFLHCHPGTPVWQRAALNHTTAAEIRGWIQANCF